MAVQTVQRLAPLLGIDLPRPATAPGPAQLDLFGGPATG